MYPGSSRKELALRVLEEYWRNGLYSYEQGRDGRWYVQKKRIPDNVFYDLYSKLCDICNADELSSPETEKALLDLINRMHSELLLPRKESLNKWQLPDSGL